jgi:hypothetical protein
MYQLRLGFTCFSLSQIISIPVLLKSTMATVTIDFLDHLPMFCVGDLPPGKYGDSFNAGKKSKEFSKMMFAAHGHPKDWSAKNFTSLTDLCTHGGNPDGNMGGIVSIFAP